MKKLLDKLNYKDQPRIALINTDTNQLDSLSAGLQNVIIDKEIDPRCPYSFILIFVKNISEVENATPVLLHNLTADGVLWFCYPKKTSKNYKSELNRDYGWKALNDSGFYGIRMVSIDNDWSALRFRHTKYIKSKSNRYINGN
ncbi:MAG: hypothetical protein HZB98_01990 [Bacteroidia bacterium]|nr:hypothetical protein [Bacteroidia bacterium]